MISLVHVFAAGNVAAALPRGRELLTNIPKPLSNVEVAYTFPNLAQESQIIVGEDVTTVITVRNDGASDINVKYITGGLLLPYAQLHSQTNPLVLF